MSVYASTYNPNSAPSSSSHHHHDSQTLLPKNTTTTTNHNDPTHQEDPLDKTYAPLITPHRLRSHLLVHNLKASGILPSTSHADDDVEGRPPQLKHSARGLEAIGFDENASMYSSFKGEGGAWKAGEGKEKKEKGEKRRFLKKLVGRGEGKGEKL